MSVLFTPIHFGNLEIKNRFINSATYEGTATENGEVTNRLIKKYASLAKGEVGLIISGMMSVHPLGRSYANQVGIHSDDMKPGLKKLVEAVHTKGGKIIFQLAHAGRQTVRGVTGRIPMAPSLGRMDMTYFAIPRRMKETDIRLSIRAFADAAQRAVDVGADGVQLHATNGFLINQFLSPFFNKRNDKWGGSDKKRFRYFSEVYKHVSQVLPDGMPIIVKLNTFENTPGKGITPALAQKYAQWMADLGIHGLELGSGTVSFSNFDIWRGDVPVGEIVQSLPFWMKAGGWLIAQDMKRKYSFEEGYTIETARMIKPLMGSIPVFAVGGLRRFEHMEMVVKDDIVDCISMSRPFLREPMLVKKFRKKKSGQASCVSCNKCVGAALNKIPIICYHKGLPNKNQQRKQFKFFS